MENVKIHEPFGNSDHNQIHFYNKVNWEWFLLNGKKQIKNTGETSTKVDIKIREDT